MSPPSTLVLVALVAYLNACTAHAASSSSSKHASKIGVITSHGFTDEKWTKGFEKAQAIVAWHTRPIEGNVPMFCFADTRTGVNSRYPTQFPAGVTTIAT
ncbi:hypothetical protein Rt10032_c07g3341 [Rhodotorula toruloides]|uniref:Uncharacterized protein n=1 Tax=Rhodotorula toruloides TaxID=5286 RepID=A0A511KIQ8_RHOTO|nr:hypothetical protein Rt10032_c07g3341 [Rhodotorula toruloides]